MSQRLAGSYQADRVEMTIGGPSLAGVAVAIPGLPNGLAFPHAIDGRGSDEFLNVSREVATNSKDTGSDGEATVQTSLNRSGMFSVTLKKSSLSNVVLSAMLLLWESGIRFYFPVTVVDQDSFGTLYEADQCWVQGWPAAGYSATLGDLTWVIECANLRMFHGARGLAV